MDSFGFTVLKMGNENNFDFKKEAINGLNALCMKAKRLRENLMFEEEEWLITQSGLISTTHISTSTRNLRN